MVLSGYQFMIGGLVMMVCGFLLGGRIHTVSPKGVAMLVYLALISSVAFSVWGILLKYHPVSRIAIFGFTNPVFGVVLSSVFLHEHLQTALEYARHNLRKTLTVEMLADAVHVSARQLSRLFRQETGKSPAKAIEGLRLEAARLMIEQSRLSLDAIARESGFRDRRHMREVFIRGYGIPPQSLRAGR